MSVIPGNGVIQEEQAQALNLITAQHVLDSVLGEGQAQALRVKHQRGGGLLVLHVWRHQFVVHLVDADVMTLSGGSYCDTLPEAIEAQYRRWNHPLV